MKKIYCKPVTEVLKIKISRIICGSGDPPSDWGGGFGQIPGIDQSEDNLLA